MTVIVVSFSGRESDFVHLQHGYLSLKSFQSLEHVWNLMEFFTEIDVFLTGYCNSFTWNFISYQLSRKKKILILFYEFFFFFFLLNIIYQVMISSADSMTVDKNLPLSGMSVPRLTSMVPLEQFEWVI